MTKTITVILAIALIAIPASVIAHIESWAEYDQRLEKQMAEMQDKLPMGEKDDEFRITSVEKNGKVITTTMETKGEFGWIAMAEDMGGVDKFKGLQQRLIAKDALMINGLELARRYTLRYRFVDNGKEVCTVDVSALIIMSMIIENLDTDDFPEYTPAPLEGKEINKYYEYEKYLKDGGYPPVMTTEELHKFREIEKHKKH